jgi:uncharacterized protein
MAAAAAVYARRMFVPPSLAVPIAAAFLVEFLFYLAPGFESARAWLERRFPGWRLPLVLVAGSVAPYLVYTPFTGQFRWFALARLTLLVAAIAFWYEMRRPSPTADAAFLVVVAAPMISHFFDAIYTSPLLKVDLEILGKLMMARLAATVVLTRRKPRGVNFGFIPSWREWKIGALHFAMFLPVGFPLALAIGLVRFEPAPGAWWKAVPLLFGMLWVVALSEEFFFRGLLQHWLRRWTSSPHAALAIASLAFGAAHLWFRAFPNWKFAIVAAAAGWFYGRAYDVAGGIRAAMVAHALTNVVLRTLFVQV